MTAPASIPYRQITIGTRKTWDQWLIMLNPFRNRYPEYDGRYVHVADQIVREFHLLPGSWVLEVGCRQGHLLVELNHLGMRVTGVEPDRKAVLAAPAMFKPMVHEWRGQSLPFSEKEFDFVLCMEALPRLENPALMVEQIERVGKRSFLLIPTAENEWQVRLMKWVNPANKHCWSRNKWKRVLDDAGYSGSVAFTEVF